VIVTHPNPDKFNVLSVFHRNGVESIASMKTAPTLAGWKADLKQLPSLGKGKVYGGRGQFASVEIAVLQQIAYLDAADRIVSGYIENLGDKAAELSDPVKQGAHYAAIQAKFVAAFPDYAMPELIGYSVYGLVQQKLAEIK
jgi:hypothetical protein